MNPRHLGLCADVSALLAAPTAEFAHDDDEEEISFDVAEVFFELNDTDGDLGIHALFDGDAWKRLRIEDRNERRLLSVNVRGRLRRQSLTEIFFESAEPTFDELSPPTFFSRFPEGSDDITIVNYEVVVEAELETADGDEFVSVLSVILPPDVTAMTIPAEFLAQSDTFKYEVLAREESWNQTAIESCFLFEEGG